MTTAVLDIATRTTANITLDATNLQATATSTGSIQGQGRHRTGKRYFEMRIGAALASDLLGFLRADGDLGGANSPDSAGVASTGAIFYRGSNTGLALGTLTANDWIGFAVDLDAGKVWYRRNAAGAWNGASTADPVTGSGGLPFFGPSYDVVPWMVFFGSTPTTKVANFGASAFVGAVPTGFSAGWDTGTAGPTNIVATQVGREAWLTEQPGPVRVTQLGYEAWFNIVPAVAVTRIGREVWFPVTSTATRRKRRVLVIGGE